MSHDRLPRLALTAGEPAGIGPDIVACAAASEFPASLICICDPDVIAERAETLGISLQCIECTATSAPPVHQAGTLAVLPVKVRAPVVPSILDVKNAGYVLECLDLAISSARRGDVDAIVTGPVHKGVINDAGHSFTGHTEYLSKDFEPPCDPVMMLVAGPLRVALVTTHMALRRVPQALTENAITYVIGVVAQALKRDFAIPRPRIGVCGLNPHAGENGHFGLEDRDVVAPAISAARTQDITVLGPLPADTAFAPSMRESIDAYVTMYHDQGLPVIKALGFGDIVNITLGLPIVRTSVDHGTAIELAGSGKAKADSLLAAVTAAIQLSANVMR